MSHLTAQPALVSLLFGGAARVTVGVLWLLEGVLKYQAGFGRADVLLVAHGTESNPRTPWWFTPVSTVMQGIPDVFGVVIPALEVLLGVALITGILTRLAAIGSVATLMLYWGSDQLIAQYPVMVMLSAIVLAVPDSGRFGIPWLLAQRGAGGLSAARARRRTRAAPAHRRPSP